MQDVFSIFPKAGSSEFSPVLSITSLPFVQVILNYASILIVPIKGINDYFSELAGGFLLKIEI